MNLLNNYNPINTKDFISHRSNPYLYSESNNKYNNNFNSNYLPSNPNQSIQKTEGSANNYVKKPINLEISPTIDNSLKDQKRETTSYLRHYSSFSNHNKYINHPIDINKKTLILDLDETLVHSAFNPFSRKSDLMLNINIEGKDRTLYVLKRPHVDEFLYELSSLYEIIIFTASISQYANPLLDLLDKNKCIKYRLYREHCTFSNGIYIKDLKIFERKISNMIIIDNNPLSYDNNIENGIPILSWYENLKDNELLKLLPILKYMSSSNVPDVRNVINKIVDRSKNEIDYLAINNIINAIPDSNDKENNGLYSNKTIENEYRKNNKSQEPRNKLYNSKDFTNLENNYNYTKSNNHNKPLKNRNTKNYNDENNNKQLLNKKYNRIISYNYYNLEEEKNNNSFSNINIDKMDPKGTRISIFAPEEYNISNEKSLNYIYNTNKFNNNNSLKRNNNEEKKFNRTMKAQIKYNEPILNKYDYKYDYNTLINKKEFETRSLTPNIENKKRNNSTISNREHSSLRNINKKFSLVELTKKALHLLDDDLQNKNNNKKENEFGKIINTKENKKLYKFNNYFNKENEIIYKDYINNNKFISKHKTINKNSLNARYFNNFIEEAKNMNEYNNKDNNNNLLTSKRINSFNDRFLNNEKLIYNSRIPLNKDNNKNQLLDRINNEKINNFLNNNKTNNKLYQTGNNFYNNYNVQNNNYLKNYNRINNDNYLNTLKKPLSNNKNNLKSNTSKNNNQNDILQNNYVSYNKNENNNEKIYNNRYEFINNNENVDTSNIISNHNSFSYLNQKKISVKNLKKSFKTDKNDYNFHHLTRSSSYIDSSSEIEKFREKLVVRENYNKKYYDDYYNSEYDKGLNYNQNNRPLYLMNNGNEKYNNEFHGTNYFFN